MKCKETLGGICFLGSAAFGKCARQMPCSNGLTMSREQAEFIFWAVFPHKALIFGSTFGLIGTHICSQTAPEFTSAKPIPRVLGGPELAFLVCIRV